MRKAILLSLLVAGASYGQRVLVNGNPNWNAVSSQFAPEPSTCLASTVGNIYIQTQNPNNGPVRVLYCMQAGPTLYQWQPIGYYVGPTLPSTCAIGQTAFITSATPGSNVYGCTALNTWTQQGGSGGGGGGALSYAAMSNAQYAAMSNAQYAAMGN